MDKAIPKYDVAWRGFTRALSAQQIPRASPADLPPGVRCVEILPVKQGCWVPAALLEGRV